VLDAGIPERLAAQRWNDHWLGCEGLHHQAPDSAPAAERLKLAPVPVGIRHRGSGRNLQERGQPSSPQTADRAPNYRIAVGLEQRTRYVADGGARPEVLRRDKRNARMLLADRADDALGWRQQAVECPHNQAPTILSPATRRRPGPCLYVCSHVRILNCAVLRGREVCYAEAD
jgi:hypothetical protein